MQTIMDTALSSSPEGNSFSFLLGEAQTLNTTGLKVMRNLASAGMIPAFCSRLNGQIRLVYDVAGFMPLSALAAGLTPAKFSSVAASLLGLFCKADQNGFIRLETLLLDADHIMVDPATAVHLIYLPVDSSAPVTAKLDSPELSLRRLLIQFIDNNPNVRSERIARFRSALKNNQTPVSSMLSILTNRLERDPWNDETAASVSGAPVELRLYSMDGLYHFTIRKRGTVIGRDPTRANALLHDSSISGAHCRIFCRDDRWLVEDLGSRNGTRLNGVLLSKHVPTAVVPGDCLKLSTLDFQIREKE